MFSTTKKAAAAMTTELQRRTTGTGGSALLGAAFLAFCLGVATAVTGAVVSGRPALLGAIIGTLIIVGVFGLGSMAVDLVSRVMPAMSLLVALMTYLLQVVLMAVIFLELSRSGALDSAVDARWLAGVVIAGTLTWMVAQVILTTRLRIPVYDLTDVGAR